MAPPLPHRLLGIWAHPDDECYLSAGLMARVRDTGGAVRVVCATRGEMGTDDPQLAGSSAFALHRQGELEASLGTLGVSDLHFLDLPDGGCAHADDDRQMDALARHLAEFGPDVVVTFGPDGITGHADHVAISRWATAVAEPHGAELLYATMSQDHVERHHDLHESLGLFADLPDGQPVAVDAVDIALQCSLGHRELVRKRSALAAHGSQTSALAALMGERTYFSWWRQETFRRPTLAERARALGGAPRELAR